MFGNSEAIPAVPSWWFCTEGNVAAGAGGPRHRWAKLAVTLGAPELKRASLTLPGSRRPGPGECGEVWLGAWLGVELRGQSRCLCSAP